MRGIKFSSWNGSISISKFYFIYQAMIENEQMKIWIIEQIKIVHLALSKYVMYIDYFGYI